MPPVISTIVMLRLFARRQRASISAYFANSLTPPTGFGLLTSLRGGFSHRSGSAWPGRSQKDGLPSARGESRQRFKAINSRTGGAAGSLPPLIGSGNGRQDAQPCSTCRSVALLRRCRLDFGLPNFGLDLLGARWSRRYRDSLGPLGLTWTKTICC